jgi:hypothetical protein
MKKVYLSPDVRKADILVDASFLLSTITIGGTTGEDLDDPIEDDPWS